MKKKKAIIGYKAFGKDMKCQGMQYEIGKTYKMEDKPRICQNGYHLYTNPLDVLNHYDLTDSNFAQVEATGETDKQQSKNQDTKICTNELTISAKLDLTTFIKASVEFLLKMSKKTVSGDSGKLASSGNYSKLASSGHYSKLASSGNYSQLASSGNSSQLASSGNYSQLASSGNSSQLASSGDYSQLASSGDSSKLASSGDSSKLASSGDSSQLASSGNYSKLASSGNYSQLASSGDSSKLASSGKNNILAGIGYNNTAKGIIGNWLVLAEFDSNSVPVCVKAEKVDGKTIKGDTYYKLENGKFTEA